MNLLDPWLVARSRAMNTELDAAPRDDTVRSEIYARHVREAMADRPDFATGEIPEADMVSALGYACRYADDPNYEATFAAAWRNAFPPVAPHALSPEEQERRNAEDARLLAEWETRAPLAP